MIGKRRLPGIVLALSFGVWAPVQADVVTDWNAITVNCVQGGTTPANRSGPAGLLDIALVQAAVHDAVQTVEGRFKPYEYENAARRGMGSQAAAAASAAYGVLAGMYGAGNACLANVTNPAVTYAGDAGVQTGAEAAAALIPLRRPTLTLPTDPFLGSNEIGQWRPTPGVTQGAATFLAVTAPFAMTTPSQFRPGPPPRLKSARYLRDYNEVKAIGSTVNNVRTPEQTDVARFWTVNFFSQWNQAVRKLADERVPKIGDEARLLALVSFAAADSQISVYDAKYAYNFWRPITAIQEGNNDPNPQTVGDASWTPFIQTPPYPDYHSGANMLAASITAVIRNFFGTDKVQMTIASTAQNLVVNPRTYARLTDIEKEMVEVRIWQGIHFRTAETVGRTYGRHIGEWTFNNYLCPK